MPAFQLLQEFTSKAKLITHYLSSGSACKMPEDMEWPGTEDKATTTANAVHRFQCTVCGNAYASKQELGVHAVNAHQGKGVKVGNWVISCFWFSENRLIIFFK